MDRCLESKKDNFMKIKGGSKGQMKETVFRRRGEWAEVIYFALVSSKAWETWEA